MDNRSGQGQEGNVRGKRFVRESRKKSRSYSKPDISHWQFQVAE